MVIRKYVLEKRDFTVEMPGGARVLSSQIIPGNISPSIWAMVDENAPKENRRFIIFETEMEAEKKIDIPSEKLRFIDTIQVADGKIIFHLFEVLS